MPAGFQEVENAEKLARVAIAMLQADLANARDWAGEPLRFLERTMEDWTRELAAESMGVLTFELILSDSPHPELAGGEEWPRFYLSCYASAGEHFGLVLGKAMEALARLNRRFPAMFWERFTGALGSLGLTVWDHRMALDEEEVGWLGDMIAEWRDEYAEEDGEECPHPQPSRCVPAYLKGQAAGSGAAMKRLLQRHSIGPNGWEGELLFGALEIEQLAAAWRQVDPPYQSPLSLSQNERRALDDTFYPWPSVVAWFNDGDDLSHLWDQMGDDLWNSGEYPAPVFVWPFDPTAAEVARIRLQLERFCAVLAKAAHLIRILATPPGPLPLFLTTAESAVGRVAALEHEAAIGRVRVRA